MKAGWILGRIPALLAVLPVVGFGASGDEHWDSAFGVPGADGWVDAMVLRGGDLFVAGHFSQIGGISATNVAKWDGTNWSALGGGLSSADFSTVLALADASGVLYAGGLFSEAGGAPGSNIARWDGTNWSALGLGVNGGVRALAFVGEELFAGGNFHSAGGVGATNIAKWDGTKWSALGHGVTEWVPCDPPGSRCEFGTVRALARSGNLLYVGGDFDRAGGLPIPVIAQWDGRNWSPLGSGMPGNSEGVHALAVHGDGLFVGGNLRWVPGVLGPGVAKWDGTNWTAVPGPAFEGVRTIVANGSEIFVGPGFEQLGPARGIAKWDGKSWSALGSGVDGAAWDLACNGTELFVAGSFSYAGGKPANGLAIWHIPHELGIRQEGGSAVVSWPATGTNFLLEAKGDVANADWTEVAQPFTLTNDECVVTDSLSASNRIYRLRRR